MVKSVIKDESILLEVFIPEKILHREGQVEAVANALKPASFGRTPRNIFLFGATGVGKTSLVKWIFSEFEGHTQSVKTVYVNCWKCSTSHSILNEIVSSLNVFTNLKQPRDELVKAISNYVKKTSKKVIICLDEVDQLKEKELLYVFSRENYGLVLVSNNKYAFFDVDSRIKSSLAFETIEFPEYKPDELFDILKERSEYALYPGSIKIEYLKIISHKSHGDSRVAIDILRNSALFAENQAKDTISIEDVIRACDNVCDSKKDERTVVLDDIKKTLYDILKSSGPISSGDLLRQYVELTGDDILERTYRKHMESLVRQNLVKSIGSGRWRNYEIN